MEVFSVLLEQQELNLEIQNLNGETPLWLALISVPKGENYGDESFAAKLLKKGSSLNATNPKTGKSFLWHHVTRFFLRRR